ncbi:hypothetical protein [Streptomyces sp. NPDC020330]|uniref:hypothetical protein n=1 Tax=unclassified Streptomyces TaxID=2593676 RepID=UPI0037A9A7F9
MDMGQRAGGAITAIAVTLDETTRLALERVTASPRSQVRQVLRARIVLAAAEGLANAPISYDLGVSVNTVANGAASSPGTAPRA